MPDHEIVSLEDYLSDRGELVVLRGPSRYRRPPAVLVNPEVADPDRTTFFGSDVEVRLPREGVALLPDVTIWGPGAIRLDDGRILAESLETAPKMPSPPPTAGPERLLPKAVFAGKLGNANYGHVLVEVLPRLGLNREALPDRVPILLHRRSRGFAPPLLEAAGFPLDRLKWMGRAPVGVRRLSWPTRNTRAPLATSPHVVRYLRSLPVARPGQPPGRRLFVGRRDAQTRHLVDEDEVLAVLEPLGFESVSPGNLSFAEQARLFAEATFVVGICGAALTNTVFMPPGSTIVMLTPSTMSGYLFWDLAAHCGHRLEVVWGEVVSSGVDQAEADARWRQKHDDFVIDVDLLADVIGRDRPDPHEIAATRAELQPSFAASVLPEPEVVNPSGWRPGPLRREPPGAGAAS